MQVQMHNFWTVPEKCMIDKAEPLCYNPVVSSPGCTLAQGVENMKKPVIITADSTVDLSRELKERYDIRIIPLMITLGEDHFLDDGVSFTPLDMYRRYRQDGTLPKTSAPGMQEILDFFIEV